MTVTIEMRHVRAAGMCSRGARRFFNQHNLDWTTFLSEGLPAEVIEATGDPNAQKVVAIAREEMKRGE